ncbi:MAG: DegT/DnrJ/EryC1/StrS family aminotransferase [Proteobacteria bacterium]|nr:DegT/DnrJ/EryC1/StrS family aminotransferase [Pseudomonadota bacterium]
MEPDLTGNELEYVTDCIRSNWISSKGPYVARFEEAFCDYLSAPRALTTSNGTTALTLALAALDLKPGDEVIVPDLTFAATANAVMHHGGVPVLVDVSETNWTLEASRIETALTPRTRGVIPVHLYGRPCDMEPIMDLARREGMFVVEDCAEALGAACRGRPVGRFGDVGCFSFFANKILTTGEGGMVVTDREDLAEKMAVLRDHGMDKSRRYWHEFMGYNFRMTSLQAAVGLAQMERLDQIQAARRRIHGLYVEALADLERLEIPAAPPWAEPVCWLFSLRFRGPAAGPTRDRVMASLAGAGIETRPFFHPLHRMPPYAAPPDRFPVSARLSDTGLSLPSGGRLSEADVGRVAGALKTALDEAGESGMATTR